MQGILYKTGQDPQPVTAEVTVYEDTGTEPNLEWLRKVLECQWVQMVPIMTREGERKGDLWIDEEGKFNTAGINPLATKAFQEYLLSGDWIAGNAVFFPV